MNVENPQRPTITGTRLRREAAKDARRGGPERTRGVRRARAEQIIREHITKSRRPNEWLASQSIAHHHVTEFAVLASEIEQLPDLQGFLKFASTPEWRRVQLRVA